MKTLLLLALTPALAFAQPADFTISIDAAKPLHRVTPWLTGSCIEDVNHEIYGGLYTQMIFGESFQEPASNSVSAMWRVAEHGRATGHYSIETNNPFVGTQSQRITFDDGRGAFGIANEGLNRWGMSFVGGQPYEVCLDARAEARTEMTVALEDAGGAKVVAERKLSVKGGDWQRLTFTLTPSTSVTNGRFAISLRRPGSVVIGYASLEPADSGYFHFSPARRDVAEGLISQGVTVLRYGGSMVNADRYRWKNMIGPRDRRPPYHGAWYPSSSDGWGILDFLSFCDTAGFLGVPDLNINETPTDMADFIDYVNGSAFTTFGMLRSNNGHPAPYWLKYMELGNEERVDDAYFKKFQPIAEAIWAKDPDMILVVGDFSYHQPIEDPFHITGADSHITTLSGQQQILRLAKEHNREVWFDVHVWTEGPDSHFDEAVNYYNALEKIADGAKFRVVVFELNANNHGQKRAIANALAINAARLDGRFPIVTSANGLQPDGQNDNGWDQGLLFLNQSKTWLQPPGYVTQMFSQSYEPLVVESQAANAPADFQICATRSDNGKTLVLSIVNPGENTASPAISIAGFAPTTETAAVEELAGPLDAANTGSNPTAIAPTRSQWSHRLQNGNVRFNFKPHSVTVIKFQ